MAAPTGYIKIGDFEGGCTESKHAKWSEIISYSHAMNLPGALSRSLEGGATTGDPEHDEFKICKPLDSATPKISDALNNGKHIDKVEIELVKHGGEPIVYMKYKLENVVITSIVTDGSPNGDSSHPRETVGMTYSVHTQEYSSMDEKGKKKGTVAATASLKEGKTS